MNSFLKAKGESMKKNRFIVENFRPEGCGCDPEDLGGCWNTMYRLKDTKTGETIGWDGGEPEDQLLLRDWSWVATAMNRLAEEIDSLEIERARLASCLEKVNANMEETERDLYLKLDEVEDERDTLKAQNIELRAALGRVSDRIIDRGHELTLGDIEAIRTALGESDG